MGEESSQGITRRDLLRRGAVLGGAVVWTTPVVQTLGMGRAFADTASPVEGPAISYVALVLTCGTQKYLVKFEADEQGFEKDPGTMQACSQVLSTYGATPTDGDDLLDWENLGNNCYKFSLKEGATCENPSVEAGRVKGGKDGCEEVPVGELPVTVCL